jgi:putative GTP pyrophosphokinase
MSERGSGEADWKQEYEAREKVYSKLCEEVKYSVEEVIRPSDIRVHAITARVKTLASLEEKAQRKLYASPLEQTPDIVGVRIVALYRSDLPRINELLCDAFTVLRQEDKVEGEEPEEFGYMSYHLEARIPSANTGPRYAGIKDITFEAQVRTVLMDAWANVSHHLAYKGDESIPPELRRDFYALSGLFYVADRHFELFLDRAREVGTEIRGADRNRLDQIPISLDSLEGYFAQRFVDRQHSSRHGVAELVDELQKFGYVELAALNDMLDKTSARFQELEQQHPPHGEVGRKYADVGVVRMSLAITDSGYETFLNDKSDGQSDDSTVPDPARGRQRHSSSA